MLEYAVSVAAVAVGAGQYVNETLRTFGMELPQMLAGGPAEGGVVNLPALIVIALATLLLVRGARESAIVNSIVVAIKAGILIFFSIVAFSAFNAGNFEPLLPMGAAGVTAAASSVFFSYIGFDAASTAGEEAKNPKRDLPRAIMLSMLIVTISYVLVAVSAIGAREWNWFEGAQAPLVQIVGELTGRPVFVLIFAVAAVLAIASVVLTVLYGQTRILLAMSRDGLVPPVFGKVSARTGTPVAGTWITGILVAITAGFIPLGALADATSIGTLFAFALVGASVMYLRKTQPKAERTFRVPLYPITPILGILACLFLIEPTRLAYLGGVHHLDDRRCCRLLGLWPASFAPGPDDQAGIRRHSRRREVGTPGAAGERGSVEGVNSLVFIGAIRLVLAIRVGWESLE